MQMCISVFIPNVFMSQGLWAMKWCLISHLSLLILTSHCAAVLLLLQSTLHDSIALHAVESMEKSIKLELLSNFECDLLRSLQSFLALSNQTQRAWLNQLFYLWMAYRSEVGTG